jgi:anti-anti-sigma factor
VSTRVSRSSGQFGMEFEYDVGRTAVTLHGELDALSVPAFAGALNALADRGVRRVTIDLADLRFCNIGGLRAMAELATRLHPDDGRVEIVSPDILMRMLTLADLRSLFVIDERPPVPGSPASVDLDLELDRAPRSSRPRASSLHRMSTGA